MSLFNHIVVAVDLRKESKKIIQKAQGVLAKGGELELLHVAEPIDAGLWAGAPFGAVVVNTEELEQEALKAKEKRLRELGKHFSISESKQHIEIGKPSRVIKKYAEDNKCDLIVIGTHGQNGWELLLGSTANGVLHGSPCDVLTIQMKLKEQ
ncbi:universal stress protein [Kangiella sediminilitoris]|uniref:Universal stress protein n=1 Tax=Kangiella sediminilitoris TaxID=1144748 RepID=A0A1B3B9E1_9GAMM|nr:universal stress protein [Kangiella sediminilitoris]AOE49424.1 Universal stress protein [Kangiella sediminilitoris]